MRYKGTPKLICAFSSHPSTMRSRTWRPFVHPRTISGRIFLWLFRGSIDTVSTDTTVQTNSREQYLCHITLLKTRTGLIQSIYLKWEHRTHARRLRGGSGVGGAGDLGNVWLCSQTEVVVGIQRKCLQSGCSSVEMIDDTWKKENNKQLARSSMEVRQ